MLAKRGLAYVYLAFIALVPALAVSEDSASAQVDIPEAKSLLIDVVDAIRQRSYRGRLTYEHSGKLEVLEIAHHVHEGREYERVIYLNGPDRALLKQGRPVNCDTRGGFLLSGGLLALDEKQAVALENVYQLKFLGAERVAGRPSWVLQLLPRDEYRHGFILAVDQESALPTKTLFVSSSGKVLERLHFISLDTNPDFLPDEFSSQAGLADDTSCMGQGSGIEHASWRPSWLPPGFVLSGYDYSEEDGHMETYTDGLASFSVFTKAASGKGDGMSRATLGSGFKKGATVVVMGLQQYQNSAMHVSVLGEIPGDTAQRILSSVQQITP